MLDITVDIVGIVVTIISIVVTIISINFRGEEKKTLKSNRIHSHCPVAFYVTYKQGEPLLHGSTFLLFRVPLFYHCVNTKTLHFFQKNQKSPLYFLPGKIILRIDIVLVHDSQY